MVSDYLVDTYNTYNHYKISNEKINWKKYKKMSMSVLTKQCCVILPGNHLLIDKYQLYIHEYGHLSYMSI